MKHKKNDTSNSVSIEEIEKSVAVDLAVQVKKLENELKAKNEEIEHLKHLLSQASLPQIGNPIKIEVTPEEEIAEIQLERLKQQAYTRDLTLEEAKKLDLFVKNKRLAQNDSTVITDVKKLPNNLTKTDLMKIASNKLKKDGNDT